MAGTVADLMVATLRAAGVRRVYGTPGDLLNGFTDALRRDGGIAWEHVRHEEAAGFAAAGEAALTGELAVCAGSCKPGNLHLVNGLFDANRSRVPVLAVVAHMPAEETGGGYFQETHPRHLFGECSVYCTLASVPGQVPRLLEVAMRAALQRGGVGVVMIPAQMLLADAPAGARPSSVRPLSAVDGAALHPRHIAAAIDRLAAEDAIFTADVGTACTWVARYLRMNGARRLIGSFGHGSMANALPHAIGAQAAAPGRQVVALSAAGGLAMLLGELLTLRQQQLPVKVVVFNNGALPFTELEMKAAGIVTAGTGLPDPDFAAIARAAGLHAARVDRTDELEDALAAAFSHDGPALVDVRTATHELQLPPALTYGEILGLLAPGGPAQPGTGWAGPGRNHGKVEPLTDSEARVLCYLQTHLTAYEIARQLHLSVHTVTTHMRHLYAKLGAHRRHEAVTRARALGLLAPASPGIKAPRRVTR
ncbi:MAG: hypothetical protein JWM19_5992 [Actinomycetia bacterium]|nr:hypothetical protein [Actinomycetes bacterium]